MQFVATRAISDITQFSIFNLWFSINFYYAQIKRFDGKQNVCPLMNDCVFHIPDQIIFFGHHIADVNLSLICYPVNKVLLMCLILLMCLMCLCHLSLSILVSLFTFSFHLSCTQCLISICSYSKLRWAEYRHARDTQETKVG